MGQGSVDPHHRDGAGRTALHNACQEGKLEVVKLLVEGCNLDISDQDKVHGVTPLHLCASAGHLDILKYLHTKQEKMDIEDKHRRTPLHYACQNGHTEVAEFLYNECKCDKSTKDSNGVTPEDLAKLNGHGDIVTVLGGQGDVPNPDDIMQNVRSKYIIIDTFFHTSCVH